MPLVRRAVTALVAVGAALAVAAPAAALPPVKHVFVIWMENKDYAETFDQKSPRAPYFAKTLPALGALLPEYYGIGHHSASNYIAVLSGQGPNPQTQADCMGFTEFTPAAPGPDGQVMGSGCVYPTSVRTIADQLHEKRLTWKGYMEDMGTPCRHPELNQPDPTQTARADDQYAARHNPFVYFHSIIDGPGCKQNDVDLKALPGDITQAGTTPAFSFITPDLCSDGHDEPCVDGRPGGLRSIDDFLREWVPRILESRGFRDDGLLVISFDEADSDDSACCGERAANTPAAGGESGGPGGGKTGAVLISPFIRPGTIDKTPYNHYSFLRTMEDLWGLAHLGYAAQDGLVPIGSATFNQTPTLTLKVKARRRNRDHVRFSIDAGRLATLSFTGSCAAASRPTRESGRRTVTIRQRRGGHCTITASRDAWASASRGFRLRAPRG
jgi:hypothetical protein